jgi:hypothetical protein
MDTKPTLGQTELLTHIVGDIAKAVSEREGESRQRQSDRVQAATGTIMSFLPRDAIEAMLAGHCVMFHELIVDSVHFTLRGEEAATRRATRSSIVAMDKAFGNNFTRLERYRTRHAEGSADVQPADARTETEIADRVRRHQARTEPPPRAAQAAPEAGTIPRPASPEAIAVAPEALSAPGPAPLTQAMGAEPPNEAWLPAAAGLMTRFNGHAEATHPRADRANGAGSGDGGNRQARRHPIP